MGIWFAPGDYNHDLAALVNKRDLLASKKPPRIVFIGGSNLSTLDSPGIENGLGKAGYAVVNMGLWGGLSMARYLEDVTPLLAPGDSVVICQEYATLISDTYYRYISRDGEADKFFFLMEPWPLHNSSARRCFLDDIRDTVLLNQLKIKTYIQMLIDGDLRHSVTGGYYYYRNEYNTHGDRRMPFKRVRPLGERGARFQEPDRQRLRYLKDFNSHAQVRGIRVLFLFPPFPIDEYAHNKYQIESLAKVLRDDIGLEILAMPETSVFPESCFANTVNHLLPECERKRSAMVLERMKALLVIHPQNRRAWLSQRAGDKDIAVSAESTGGYTRRTSGIARPPKSINP